MKTQLDNKNIQLMLTLFGMKQNLDIYRFLCLNSERINKAEKEETRTFWMFVQQNAIRLFIVDLCKIYEKKKDYELNSIPEILNLIKQGNIPIPRTVAILKFIKTYNTKELSNEPVLEIIDGIFVDFIKSKNETFNICKDYRDKLIVHAEDSVFDYKDLPSYEKLKELLDFGINFYSMVVEAYFVCEPFSHKTDKRTLVGLYSVFSALGYENIKKEVTAPNN